MTVSGESPTFAGVVELADLLELLGVVNEPDLVLPG